MSNRAKGFTLALISALLYGIIPVIGKQFVNHFSPLFVAFAVTIIADLFLGIIVFWRKEMIKNFLKKEIPWVIGIGLLAASGSVFSFFGLSLGKASEAGFFFQFETFFAGILAFFLFKEKLSSFQVKGFLLMFIGAFIFTNALFLSFRISNLFFLGSAFVWGLNDVIIKRKTKNFSSFFLSFGRNFFSALFLFPFAFRYIPNNIQKINTGDIFYFLLYGAIVAAIILCLYSALSYIKTAEATSFQLLIPLVTLTVAFFVLGEQMSSSQILGAALILCGLFLITQKNNDNNTLRRLLMGAIAFLRK